MIGFLLFNLIFKAIPHLLQLHREYTDSWPNPIYLAFKKLAIRSSPSSSLLPTLMSRPLEATKDLKHLGDPLAIFIASDENRTPVPFFRQADVFIDQLVAPIIAELKIVHLREILDLKKRPT